MIGILIYQKCQEDPWSRSVPRHRRQVTSEARKRMASAISSGCAMRFIGTREMRSALFSGVPANRFNMPVSIVPRSDDIDAHPGLGKLKSCCLGKTFHRMLAGNIESRAGCTCSVVSTGNVDDAPAALREHHS